MKNTPEHDTEKVRSLTLALEADIYNDLRNFTADEKRKYSEVHNSYLYTLGINSHIYYWYYEFLRKEFELDLSINELFQECFRIQRDSHVYSVITAEWVAVVSKYPKSIKRNNDLKLHCPDGQAVEWNSISENTPFDCYYWNGTNVPEQWIMSKETITKEDILKEDNAEKRRCLMEILGAKKYYDLMSDGNGLILIDEDTDDQGNPMRLYETKNNDAIINSKVQFLEVVDPSTGRIYNIYPPEQNAKNVWDAKAQTFNNEKLYVRHGDVGIVRKGYTENKPVMET